MTPHEAVSRLVFHTTREPGSFPEMLRPYRGLRQDVMDDVLAALRACADLFAEERLDRELMAAVWGIQAFGRAWALEPDGMLRRNRLISDADQEALARFLDHFSWSIAMLFHGNPEDAFQ